MVLTAMFPYFNITPLDYKKASDSLMSLTHSYSIRLTGFYLNPNLTGYISNIALVFALTSFLSIKKLNYLSIGLLFLSIYVSLRSFSKTSIIITLLILLLFFAFILFSRSFWFSKQLSNKRRFLFIVVLILFGVIIKGNLWLKDLDEGQRDRLSQVFSILVSGEFNKKTTTYRSEIWETGVVKIFESPFIGNGYGSFDYFEEEGQGIHNMFLKMFGEAGIFVGIVYLIFHLVVLRYIVLEREYSYKFMLMGLFLSTVIFNLSNHNAFQTYLISMVYGLILAFSYVQK
jgi:O-antigen ligase